MNDLDEAAARETDRTAGGAAGARADAAREADALGRMLPAALAAGSRHGDRLAEALRPHVEKALAISARRDRPRLLDALYVLVWPALWKAAVERLRRLLVRVDRAILVTISPRGLAWRIEALRRGRPFHDVLRENLDARRVKHAFLIHRDTGTLLASAHREELPALDGDMLSAMLTAIQDFVHDSFAHPRGERLSSIQVGDLTVCLEQGRGVILAGVVEGVVSDELRATFHDALQHMEREFEIPLAGYDGNNASFAAAAVYLESCVRLRSGGDVERISRLTWGVLGLVAAALALLAVAGIRERINWDAYVREIASHPGIVVIDSGWRNGRFHIRGMRDPLALDPVAMLAPMGIDRAQVDSDWNDYQAIIPELALIRARQVLAPPDTVTLDIDGRTLRARGTASGEWIRNAQSMSRMLPGVSYLDVNDLQTNDRRDMRLWDIYIGALRAQPGLVVLEQGDEGGRFFVTGLRDPSAADPVALLRDVGLGEAPVQSRWEPYPSSVPAFVLARARATLSPPPTVTLGLGAGGRLTAQGEASHTWIREARLLARTIAGIGEFDMAGLVDRDIQTIEALKGQMEALAIRFMDRTTDLWPGQAQRIEELGRLAGQLDAVSRPVGLVSRIELRGFVSDAPDRATARTDALAMANRIVMFLAAQGIDTRDFAARAGEHGGRPPTDLPETSRRWVTVHVMLPAR